MIGIFYSPGKMADVQYVQKENDYTWTTATQQGAFGDFYAGIAIWRWVI